MHSTRQLAVADATRLFAEEPSISPALLTLHVYVWMSAEATAGLHSLQR